MRGGIGKTVQHRGLQVGVGESVPKGPRPHLSMYGSDGIWAESRPSGNQAHSTRGQEKTPPTPRQADSCQRSRLPNPPPALPAAAGDERRHRSRRIQVSRFRLVGLIPIGYRVIPSSFPFPFSSSVFLARVGVDTAVAAAVQGPSRCVSRPPPLSPLLDFLLSFSCTIFAFL